MKSEIADAAMRGDVAAVRALLAKKVNVNAPQNDGSTALHWAVQRGNVELVNLLVRVGRQREGGHARRRDAAVAGEPQRRRRRRWAR